MKIVCFIGSGFNYMLADIAKAQDVYTKDDVPVHEKIVSLNRLWDQLEPLLSPFSSFIPTTNGEELIGALEGIQHIYNKFTSKAGVSLSDATVILVDLVKTNMQKIGERFTKFEQTGGYSDIYKALPTFGLHFKHLLNRNHVSDFYLCTTNYDGIIDSLLTYNCKEESKRKFLLKDGFVHGNFNYKLFKSFKYKIAHLHGSYKYFRGIDGTRKLERCTINTNPVMNYNSPNRKEAVIMEDPVLSANFLELERQLKLCDKVIIIGNSFKTEPHLKRLLNTCFNRPNTEMIVCSDKPNEVVSELDPYYDYHICSQSTGHVKSEKQLIELFEQLFTFTSMNMLATA